MNTTIGTLNLGFLTILHDPAGYLGGYLVTNTWGRPLEFRLSTAVQPNRVQQILYGSTLLPHIFGNLIGKTLVDKAGTMVELILTDQANAIALRSQVDVPVACLAEANGPEGASLKVGLCVRPASSDEPAIFVHERFPADVSLVRDLLQRLDESLELAEPFVRIRDAIGEARKMGVTSRG